MLRTARASAGIVVYHVINCGSVRDVIDNTGTTIDHIQYDSFV